jgi:cytochrome c553
VEVSRREFTNPTKRAAWDRSGGLCEASGDLYGFPPGVRCNANLNLGVEYDHIDPDANSKDNSLENCCAVCSKCHHWKTNKRDKPLIAKTDRQQDAARNIRGPKRDWGKGRRLGQRFETNARDIRDDL